MARRFNLGEPLAFFITWTCYGTWLHGDKKGWCRKGEGAFDDENKLFSEIANSKLKEQPFLLSTTDRQVCAGEIQCHCNHRKWNHLAVSVRTNHIHVVVEASRYLPAKVCGQLKAWCTRKLKATYPNRFRFWTEGASYRWINFESDLDEAIAYVNEAQDRKHLDL